MSVSSDRLLSLLGSVGVPLFDEDFWIPFPCEYCARGLPEGGESYAGGGEGGVLTTLNVPIVEAVFVLCLGFNGGTRTSLKPSVALPFRVKFTFGADGRLLLWPRASAD